MDLIQVGDEKDILLVDGKEIAVPHGFIVSAEAKAEEVTLPNGELRYRIPGAPTTGLEVIAVFVNTGELHLTRENIESVLAAALKIRCLCLVCLCEEYNKHLKVIR